MADTNRWSCVMALCQPEQLLGATNGQRSHRNSARLFRLVVLDKKVNHIPVRLI